MVEFMTGTRTPAPSFQQAACVSARASAPGDDLAPSATEPGAGHESRLEWAVLFVYLAIIGILSD